MDDAELLLKELRIDWETLLTEEFNPLKQALENKKSSYKHSNYRNTYHKVEKVMEKIIELNYKGFSDSVISYMESYNCTLKCLESVGSITSILDKLANIKVDIRGLDENYNNTSYLRRKNTITSYLCEITKLHADFDSYMSSKMYIEGCLKIKEIYDIVRNCELDTIKGVHYFMDDLEIGVKTMFTDVFELMSRFIFYDEVENKKYYKCIEVMNRVEDFDKFLYQILEVEVFNVIEKIIIEVDGKTVDDYNEYINNLKIKINSAETLDTDSEEGGDMLEDFREPKISEKDDKKVVCGGMQKLDKKHIYFLEKDIQLEESKTMKNLDEYCYKDCLMNIHRKLSFDDFKINVLVKKIVNKIRSIRYNLFDIQKKVQNRFTDLNKKLKNTLNEQIGLQIFSNNGEEIVKSKILNIIRSFINSYSDISHSYIETKDFKLENIVDDINYFNIYENKYNIYKKITESKAQRSYKKNEFTVIVKPTMKTCLKMNKHVNDPTINRKCKEFIKNKGDELLKEFIFIFQNDNWERNEYSTRKIHFYNEYKYIFDKNYSIIDVIGREVLDTSHSFIFNKLIEKYNYIFKYKVIRNCEKYMDKNTKYKNRSYIDVNLTKECIEHISSFCINQSIDFSELFLSKSAFDNLIFTVNTMYDINVFNDAIIDNLINTYIHSVKLTTILEIMYYFDIFYREGIYTKDFYINKIGGVVEKVKDSLCIKEVFDVLNLYCVGNCDRLRCFSKESLLQFITKLELLDEVLVEVDYTCSLKSSIEFFNGVVDGSCNDDLRSKLRKKIGM